jgi:glycosyltransferase involved in cell wall biosynthesis
MYVLHVSHLCHRATAFGTERYQHDLIAESRQHGVRAALLWLSTQATPSEPDAAVPVLPITTPSIDRLRTEIELLLAADPPAIIHFHTTGRAEAVVAQVAHARGIPYAFSYHAPAALCATGSLLRWGSVVCDGAVRVRRCAACAAFGQLRAMPRALSWRRLTHWSSAPPTVAMGRPQGLRRQAEATLAFLAGCDRVLVHAERARAVLRANGVSPDALSICSPGVSSAFAARADRRAGVDAGEFVVGYIGRLDRLKGAGMLVDAFMRTTWPAARLRVVGVTAADRAGGGHAWRVMQRARRDPRISFEDMQPLTTSATLYAGLGLVAIPSVGVETGPLVLREALALGLPVLATDRVGEPELTGAQARVIEPNTIAAWTRGLEQAFDEARRGALPRPSSQPVRTMREVAGDVVAIYRSILARRGAPAS